MKTLSSRQKFREHIQLPGDKSISHRCLILAALAEEVSVFENLSEGKDVCATQNVLRQLSVPVENENGKVRIQGRGLYWNAPQNSVFDCENAGTLMRLMTGVLCGQKFSSTLIGDASLMSRPMDRVSEPLQKIGARIELLNAKAPIHIKPSLMRGGDLYLESPSAQVKSAVMLASLYCQDSLTLQVKQRTRNHTELLFPFFGIPIEKMSPHLLRLYPNPKIRSVEYKIPCDPSAAAFWIIASFLSGESVYMKNVCLNPTRLGTLEALKKLNLNVSTVQTEFGGPEIIGEIFVQPSEFDGFDISEVQLPSLIDEVPVLAILATQANSESIIRNATELRYKETDRIESIQRMFQSLGLKIFVEKDTLCIPGKQILRGGTVDSRGDHRIAMAAAIASTASEGPITILNPYCAEISDPSFWGNFL